MQKIREFPIKNNLQKTYNNNFRMSVYQMCTSLKKIPLIFFIYVFIKEFSNQKTNHHVKCNHHVSFSIFDLTWSIKNRLQEIKKIKKNVRNESSFLLKKRTVKFDERIIICIKTFQQYVSDLFFEWILFAKKVYYNCKITYKVQGNIKVGNLHLHNFNLKLQDKKKSNSFKNM